MNSETPVPDPYETVLADLRAKREQIDQAIRAIELFRGHGGRAEPAVEDHPPARAGDDVAPGMFLGMSIADAAKKLLSIRKQAMSNADIASALRDGGLVMSAHTDHQNIVGSTLTRRFEKVGDVVRVGRGIWGLKEWYPNRSFKPSSKGNGDAPKSGTSEPERPFEPVDDDPF
jgi:hypothetical protein